MMSGKFLCRLRMRSLKPSATSSERWPVVGAGREHGIAVNSSHSGFPDQVNQIMTERFRHGMLTILPSGLLWALPPSRPNMRVSRSALPPFFQTEANEWELIRLLAARVIETRTFCRAPDSLKRTHTGRPRPLGYIDGQLRLPHGNRMP